MHIGLEAVAACSSSIPSLMTTYTMRMYAMNRRGLALSLARVLSVGI